MKFLTREDVELLDRCTHHYSNWIYNNVIGPANKALGQMPVRLNEFQKNLDDFPGRLNNYITQQNNFISQIPDLDKQLMKRVILFERQMRSEHFEEKNQLTNSPEVRMQLEAPLTEIQRLTNGFWFKETHPSPNPKLTDYLTIEQCEKVRTSPLEDRTYDEKFHVLMAPQLFLPDLKHYRQNCGLRDIKTTIAFIDIDNFKKFNTDNGETTVDREVLPRFMATLEAEVYARGFAYRFGGDEYAVILPNADLEDAKNHLERFKCRLQQIDYGNIVGNKPDVTAGLFEIDLDTPYTNSECLKFAEQAKNEGKVKCRGSIWASRTSGGEKPDFHQL